MATNYERPQIESRQPIRNPLIGAPIASGLQRSAAFRRAASAPPRNGINRTPVEPAPSRPFLPHA
jgi:hypothetical protein